MRNLFAVGAMLLAAVCVSADEVAYISLQSGSWFGPTPVHDRGIYGQGQLIAVLDTGVDYNSCFFVEPDNTPPPVNTGTPQGGLQWQNIDLTRRKIVAYNFLFSCDQYPGRSGCDQPGAPNSLDNQGHGTHTASTAAGDRGVPLAHDFADGVAPGAKLIVQDGGFVGGDRCTQFPGAGCPANLTPIFEQAYKQGARIHSNSWGDRQGAFLPPVPTANYPQSAYDVDAFAWSHPDMLIVFNTGNLTQVMETPLSSLSAPGSAKNTLQIGGTRTRSNDDDTLAYFTFFGPARDGRIKPDLVAPARVLSGARDQDGNPATCEDSRQPGTSFASPTVAGAAALVRQYYTDGFYPTGERVAANSLIPSAALLKATLIASARAVPLRGDIVTETKVPALPVPSHEQGWGFPVLDDSLYFAGDARKLQVVDVPLANGLAEGQSSTVRVNVKPGTPLKAVLVWTDPPGHIASPSDTSAQLVNDLDLRVFTGLETKFGNGAPDRINNVEVVSLDNASGTVAITVSAHDLKFGARQSYALVITGELTAAPKSRSRAVRH
ncbi:MAG TPA: S8 family serine peptidase [Thermoanaerobaculia bacterium]|nr:S8 family serine peptidase [Thermoanaerobaculia bacterium]